MKRAYRKPIRPRVYANDGSWYWVVPHTAQWIRLCRVSEGEARLDARLKVEKLRIEGPAFEGTGNTPVLVARYVIEHGKNHRDASWPYLGRCVRQGFADVDVELIDMAYVAEFLRSNWEEKLAMQRAIRAFLSGFFRWCMEHRYMSHNPCAELRLKCPPPRATYITTEDFSAIRKALAADDHRYHSTAIARDVVCSFVDLCYLTFQRSTDIRLLKWEHVDHASGVIHFRPSKTSYSSGTSVDIQITPEIKAALDRAKNAETKESDFVIRARNGHPVEIQPLRAACVRACARAGLKDRAYTIKDLRAKALTDGALAGHGLEALKTAAAHTETKMTKVYLKRRMTPVSSIRMVLPAF